MPDFCVPLSRGRRVQIPSGRYASDNLAPVEDTRASLAAWYVHLLDRAKILPPDMQLSLSGDLARMAMEAEHGAIGGDGCA